MASAILLYDFCHMLLLLYKSSAAVEMGNRARKVGGEAVVPFAWGKLRLHLTQCPLGRGLPPYQVAS